MHFRNSMNSSSYVNTETSQQQFLPRSNTNFLTGALENHNELAFGNSQYAQMNTSFAPLMNTSIYMKQQPEVTVEQPIIKKLTRSVSVRPVNNEPPTRTLREVFPVDGFKMGKNMLIADPTVQSAHPYVFNNTLKGNIDNKENKEDYDHWVTVFGYNKTEAEEIYLMFCKIGSIVVKKVSNSANYMHLKYENKMHVLAAHNKNGQFHKNSMIGVKRCTDTKLIDEKFNFYVEPSTNMNTYEEPLKEATVEDVVPTESVLNSSFKKIGSTKYCEPAQRPQGFRSLVQNPNSSRNFISHSQPTAISRNSFYVNRYVVITLISIVVVCSFLLNLFSPDLSAHNVF